MVMDFLGFYISEYAQKRELSDATFFIEDFISLGEVVTRRTRLSKKVAISRIMLEDYLAILECFVGYPGIWSYRIYMNPKKFLRRDIDRLMVQRCVSRLAKEGLIDDKASSDEEVKMKMKRHSGQVDTSCLIHKKGKKLSTYGIYYLFLNIEMGMMYDWTFRAMLKNYGQNILFQLFLYPYLDRQTLLAIQDSALLSRIYLYLQECCIEIGNIAYRTGNDAHLWQTVPPNEARRLLNFLEQKCGLPWLKYASLDESGDNNLWRIWGGANYASIKLDRQKNTATMQIYDSDNQKEYTLIIKEPTPDFFRPSKPTMSTKNYRFARYLIVSAQQLVPSLLFDLASRAAHKTDFEILQRDEKFMESLQKIKMKFDGRYNSLTDLSLK